MVVLAREYRNLTQEQVARKLFVSQATIAKIEGGLSPDAPPHIVERLVKALEFPKEFFFQEEARLGFGSSAFYYRKRQKITAADRRRISGLVNILRINIKRLLSVVDLEPNRELPQFDIEEFDGRADRAAMVLRAHWNLPDGPIRNLMALIESAGVIVIPCNFGTKFMDATSLRLTDAPPMIFINRDIPGDRFRYTLAHELGHLVMHDTPRETMEDEADAFAAELLMPGDEMRPQFQRIGRVRLQDLANLKPYWKVSMSALLMRATSIGHINRNQGRYLWMQMSKLGYRTKEPNPIEKEQISNYPNLLLYYTNELEFGIEDVAQTVAIWPREFELLHEAALRPRLSASHLRVVQ